ncbi:hypothetical protein NDU88_005919 [Pleurodeles waltl]|uniref:Uncharacterized protein n=1 Tax=Pleurodeles waltl TaxID=8319 RepID=A0AAV7WD81_PLEWA|nr:hypothetical protein NDU88_005919 [Pleurodeles waltl]
MVKGLLGVWTAARGKRRGEGRQRGRLDGAAVLGALGDCRVEFILPMGRFVNIVKKKKKKKTQCCIYVRTLAHGLVTRTPMVKGLLGVWTAARGKRRGEGRRRGRLDGAAVLGALGDCRVEFILPM